VKQVHWLFLWLSSVILVCGGTEMYSDKLYGKSDQSDYIPDMSNDSSSENEGKKNTESNFFNSIICITSKIVFWH
jgi:hypothetical protein